MAAQALHSGRPDRSLAAAVAASTVAPRVVVAGTWVEPGVCRALCSLVIDDQKGNPRRRSLPTSIYREHIAPFLRFDRPVPDQLYALGGRNEEHGPLSAVEMFDTWRGCWVTCPSMQARRGGCAASALPDGRLLVVGGYDANGIVKGILDSCEVFDSFAGRWSDDVAPLNRARWGHGCAPLQGLIFAVGGCSLAIGGLPSQESMETLRSCEAYDISLDRWSPVADLCVARGGSRLVPIGSDRLAAVGGCDDVFGHAEMLRSVELYDVSLGHWALLETQLTVPRTTAAVAPLDDSRLLVVGGASAEVPVVLASAEVYSVPQPSSRSCGRTDGACVEGVDAPSPCSTSASTSASTPSFESAKHAEIANAADGRMGCQAISIDLPSPGSSFPLRDRRCVLVVGGEEEQRESLSGASDDIEEQELDGMPATRQFSSVLVYDVVEGRWRPEESLPPMPTPRTAMALCVAHGGVACAADGATVGMATQEPPAKRRRSISDEGGQNTEV
eukprot:TRINITY_DN13128_c0_g1_i1.p1 TRINITY_DN13128_c0_g1~~TRINITY_DN13128_c0_g1_i1.p1  ORF type:complete len:519 (+),score=70.35 TRINITY_DN13128_c0_g1_i1:54-1559(+)